MFAFLEETGEIYQGHFGSFTITKADRLGVAIYRTALLVAALCFAGGAIAVLVGGAIPPILNGLTGLFILFCLAFGVCLITIHIYMATLHRALQLFWAIGCSAALWITWQSTVPLALAVYENPLNLMGIGWIFVALTGLYFKEAFCFNHWEARLLTAVVPILLLGHWLQRLPVVVERSLLLTWAILFLIFAIRKFRQPIPADIGDKTVFDYLRHST